MEEYNKAMEAYKPPSPSHIMQKRRRPEIDYSKINNGPEIEEEIVEPKEKLPLPPPEPRKPKSPAGLFGYHFYVADSGSIAFRPECAGTWIWIWIKNV